MKLTFTILGLFISIGSFAQITITSSDMPVPTGPFNNIEYSPIMPSAPPLGASQTWDYSTYTGTTLFTNIFTTETDTFFTNAGVDVSRPEFKDLNLQYAYTISTEYDFNSNGVMAAGIIVPAQAYDLSAVTGSTNDSLIFPQQQYLFTTQKTMMQFPFTMGSSWSSQSRCDNAFDLTVLLLGLNHTPGNHVYYTHRHDSIVGWGTLRVYTVSGPSMWYDVLMDKYEEYSIDSFYLNGSPASSAILTAFSVTQGQKTNAYYGYDFYRAGSFNPLVKVNYFSDSTFTFIQGTYQAIDNITGVENPGDVKYSTLVFPNPTNGSELNIKIFGEVNVHEYVITDVAGRIVTRKKIETGNGDMLKIQLDNIANGNYNVSVNDEKGNRVVSESITVSR